jgi:hypothetical protein
VVKAVAVVMTTRAGETRAQRPEMSSGLRVARTEPPGSTVFLLEVWDLQAAPCVDPIDWADREDPPAGLSTATTGQDGGAGCRSAHARRAGFASARS